MGDNGELLKTILVGLVRAALMALFGWFIAKGYVTEAQLTVAAPIVAGAVVVVGTMVWGRIKAKYKLQAALELPANPSPERVEKRAAELNPLLPGGN